VRHLLQKFRPFSAHLVVRPFLEAYRVVGDALESRPSGEKIDEDRFLDDCLGLGKQYRLQKRIRSPESVSKVLFATALRLAGNRNLIDGDTSDLPGRRSELAAEIRATIRRADAIEALAASRRSGLIG